MKDRLVTLALALAALGAFYVLLGSKSAPPVERATRPVSIEAGPNGYLGLVRWLDSQHISTSSLRHRYDGLAELTQGRSRDGHLLISTVPHIYPIRSSEADELLSWIAAGNTLFLVAGLSDTPDWSMGEGMDPLLHKHIEAMTGLEFIEATAKEAPAVKSEREGEQAVEDEQARSATLRERLAATTKFAAPLVSTLVPIGTHPLLAGVPRMQAISEFPSAKWRERPNTVNVVLTLAKDSATGEPALWLVRHGEGQIIVSAYGSILTNKQLGKEDNARFVANLVHWSLGPQGRVIVDDAHQGLVGFYDPAAFFGDKRLHKTLWWLLGLWFVFVLGSQRLRPGRSQWQPVEVTSFVRATGGFLARVLRPATAARRLFSNFFDDVARHTGLAPDGAIVWDWLSAHAALPPRELAQLRELHSSAVAGRRVDPVRVQTLLAQLRERLK
jgi:hypothetical protein